MLAQISSASPDGKERDAHHGDGFHHPALADGPCRSIESLTPFMESDEEKQGRDGTQNNDPSHDRRHSRVGTRPSDNSTIVRLRRHSRGCRPEDLKFSLIVPFFVAAAALALSACATPARMHDAAQLNTVATGCGMALGELIQDAEQKKLLIALRNEVSPQQRVCITQWARRNGLKPVFVNMDFQS